MKESSSVRPRYRPGGHLDVAPRLPRYFLIGVGPQHLKESVIQRAGGRGLLGLQIAGGGSPAAPPASTARRVEDDAVDLLGPEGRHRGGHRQIGLTGARGANAKSYHIVPDSLHIFLPQGLGLDRLALGSDIHNTSLANW